LLRILKDEPEWQKLVNKELSSYREDLDKSKDELEKKQKEYVELSDKRNWYSVGTTFGFLASLLGISYSITAPFTLFAFRKKKNDGTA
jgi:hypothetical protein